MKNQIGRRRLTNIIRNLSNGDCYYLNMSPRISHAEIAAVENALNTRLQTEYVHGADRFENPHAVYPIDKKHFRERALASGFLGDT